MNTIHTHGDPDPILTDTTPADNLAAALAAFQAEVPVIPKSKRANVGKYNYTYASLADVMSVAGPLLGKHGLSFTAIPRPGSSAGGLDLVGRLMHTSGETIEGSLPIRGGTPQELGSSLTYMRRYLLGCLTGVVTDDDLDGALTERVNQVQGHALRERLGAPRPSSVTDVLSDKDRDKIEAGFLEVGKLRDAEVTAENRAAALSKWSGREIRSADQLTAGEAENVLRLLTSWAEKLRADGEQGTLEVTK